MWEVFCPLPNFMNIGPRPGTKKTMSVTGSYVQNSEEIVREIERKAVVLGINWEDEAGVRALAHEALTYTGHQPHVRAGELPDYHALAKFELFGLAALMLKTMEMSAHDGLLTHGSAIWKTFARALWQETELLQSAKSL